MMGGDTYRRQFICEFRGQCQRRCMKMHIFIHENQAIFLFDFSPFVFRFSTILLMKFIKYLSCARGTVLV